MDLTNKQRIDFTDAHLWAGNSKFFCSVPVGKLPQFFKCLAGMKLTVYPFMDFDADADVDTWPVTIEAVPAVDIPPFTCQQIIKFLEVSISLCARPSIEHDGWVALLAEDGTILERWEKEA